MKKRMAYILALVLTAGVFSGCDTYINRYEHQDKYTVGGAELTDEISRIQIDWLSGDIEIRYHQTDTVQFSESSNRAQTEKETMRYWLDGKTLHIRFSESGVKVESGLKKKLTLYLPEHLTDGIFEIDSVSADVLFDDITAKSVEIDTASGSVDFNGGEVVQEIAFDTASGDFTALLNGRLGELNVDTVSGNVQAELTALGLFDIDSTSGDVMLSAETAPERGEADIVSGDFTLHLPEDASFYVQFETVSGSVKSDFEMKIDTEKDTYTCGDGDSKYEIETVSGDVFLIK